MWIFTKQAFLTVVDNKKDESGNTVIVRARVEQDLLDFKKAYIPDGEKYNVTFHQKYDYPYRVTVPKTAYAQALYAAAMDIDYRKFKESVRENIGPERFGFMNRLWSILTNLEKDKNRIRHYFDRERNFEHPDINNSVGARDEHVTDDAEDHRHSRSRLSDKDRNGHYPPW